MTAVSEGLINRIGLGGHVSAVIRSVTGSVTLRRMRNALRVPTHLGWTVVGTGIVAGVVGWSFAWTELRMIALFCLFLLVYAGFYTLGKAGLDVEVSMSTPWVSRGSKPEVSIDVTNVSSRRLSSGLSLEVPIALGRNRPELRKPPLGALSRRASRRIELTDFVPTERRGVVTLGPIQIVRGDPIGLLRRPMALSEPRELVVKPDTVVISSLGAGLLKDLEGKATNDRSLSDVAFHSLREYVPGDDLRHIHAFTSARFGKPMVRQFVDTRTAHLSIVVAAREAEYGNEQEFEDAVSIAGSIAVRGVDDDQRVGVLVGEQHTPTRSRQSRELILDPFARAEYRTGLALVPAARRMDRLVPDTSIAVLVTGGRAGELDLQKAAKVFGPDVRCIAIQVDSTADRDLKHARRLLRIVVPNLAAFKDIGPVLGKGWS